MGGVVFYVVFILRSAFRVQGQLTYTLFDDAMVSLTYARSLADGHGLVWMPGGPRVEGYTNFLWTLAMALPHLAGVPERLIPLTVMGFGAGLLVATSLLTLQLARRLARLPVSPVLAAAATAFSYPLLFWTLRGLEVGLVACLVTAAAVVALRLVERPSAADRAALCAVCAAAVLTRTDAAALVAVVIGWLALRPGGARRDALAGGFVTVVTLAAHTAFRVAYYGSALPNTYTLKLAGHPLAERIGRGAPALWDLLSGTLLAPAAFTLVLLVVRRGSLRSAEWLLGALVAASMAYSVYVGGDVWEFAGYANRFVSVALPALFVLAVLGIEALLDTRGAWAARHGNLLAGAAGLLLIGLTNAPSFTSWAAKGGLHVQDDEIMVRTALAIRAATPEDARVAVVWAGAIPYFSHRKAIDLFGKTDPAIAALAPRRDFLPGHDKWDFAYSVGRLKPDLISLAWNFGADDQRLLGELGYEKVGAYWLRHDAEIDRFRLARPWR